MKRKLCESELVQLAGTVGNLHWLDTATEEEFKRREPHIYTHAIIGKNISYKQYQALWVGKLQNSIEFQRGQIALKLDALKVEPSELTGLAQWCYEIAA